MLVLALETQKSSLNSELKDKITEIKKHRIMIQKRIENASNDQ